MGTSPQIIVDWFDADEEHVPLNMFARCGRPSTREGLIQQYEVGHLIDLRQKPVGKTTTAAAGNLPAQQLDRAVEDSVVVRFRKAIPAVIDEPNHTCILNCRPEHRVGLQHPLPFCRR